MKLAKEILVHTRCPNCLSQLAIEETMMICINHECKLIYPIVNDIPVLINERNSVFNISDFSEQKETTFKLKKSGISKAVKRIVPSINLNVKAKKNYKKLASHLLENSTKPLVLVIGGSIPGEGMESIILESKIHLVDSDVTFGPRTQIIFDAHDIPFPNDFFDGVIIQAVLEHVIDPFRCVSEIHRVLKQNGLVYAETPFIAQVHLGKYDFHRFTYLAHRRLFRRFTEIESGAVCGPGMALAWTYSYFIFSFFSSKKIRRLLIPFTNLTSFFWKYFDYILIDKPGTYDAALGYYFMGKKSDVTLDDRELLNLYRGLLQ